MLRTSERPVSNRLLGGGLVSLAACAAAASLAGFGWAGAPRSGILGPVGGGVRIAYSSVTCSFDGTARVPRLTCSTSARGFGAGIDRRHVDFFRGSTRLLTVAQRAGAAVYGDYAPDHDPGLIRLAAGATVGFLGTNIACSTVANGLRCLAHAGQGLPGPCCGPNYGLHVGSSGFFLSPTRLQELHVVGTGVSEGSGPHPPPFRVLRDWRL
jgi:hypothetical protein